MKLRALDQVHVSSVSRDSLRKNTEFEVSDAAGQELLKAKPGLFERVERAKKETSPSNKAEGAAPSNKSGNQRKKK